MISVLSSNISAIGYDAAAHHLYVRFHSGTTYRYSGVPSSIHSGLMNATSKDSYLTHCIKDRFPCSTSSLINVNHYDGWTV
ncbi:KTSC domain-containing protein [Paenibacillus sp. 1011MAR3C5]|uniref:KTSC domain-containing protein n=1 Tax=Paenibacillus sp. 1011MAR3C5 TaxID=1675787 RepID=UPI002175991B|nr:KTSC domain-containing protein [Paenibacillus sp. 1011MAR3C5]